MIVLLVFLALVECQSLRELMDKYQTDKGFLHAYYRQYERLLAPLRFTRVRLLEIGVQGGRSMHLWREYFPNAELLSGVGYGHLFDTADCTNGIVCYHGDQSNVSFLDELVTNSGGQFDVIIDDGSHVPEHQFISFRRLMQRDALVDGGLYVVEDVETSYWLPGSTTYGYPLVGTGLHGRCSFIERTKLFVDIINRQYLNHALTSMSNRVDMRIESVEYSQNMISFRTAGKESERFMNRPEYKEQKPQPVPKTVKDWKCTQ
jgi:hypothetical protein